MVVSKLRRYGYDHMSICGNDHAYIAVMTMVGCVRPMRLFYGIVFPIATCGNVLIFTWFFVMVMMAMH